MSTFPANGFEIDDDYPQVPLIALIAAKESLIDEFGKGTLGALPHGEFVLDLLMERLGIPMHILAETDQNLHG